jgi:replication factor C subunit 3/5
MTDAEPAAAAPAPMDATPVADRRAGAAAGASGKAAATGAAASNQPWIEKYRPRTLDDVAAHKDIIDTS